MFSFHCTTLSNCFVSVTQDDPEIYIDGLSFMFQIFSIFISVTHCEIKMHNFFPQSTVFRP